MKRKIAAFFAACALLASTAGAALTVEDARYLVEKLYIDPVPAQVLERDTVEGIFDGLDRYSAYLPPRNYDAFLNTMNDVSQIGLGIASTMSEDGKSLHIEKVFAGGAAQAGGVTAGDLLLAVDGKLVADSSGIQEVVSWMKGEEGTRVTITLRRADGREEELTLTRAPYVIPYTEYELVDGHIGYISCTSFGEETYGHFLDALEELEGEVNCWVVDLRENSGGLTAAAAQTAGVFTGAGNQALLRTRAGEYYAFAADGERTTLYPAIVLVSGQTASAAELLSAALRDGKAGLLIGSRTFGKGVAQTVVDKDTEPEMFADGDAVRITSARFYSGNGVCNDKMGVLPHLLVDDRFTADIAYLLTHPAAGEDNQGLLRLHLGSWRWYLDLDEAREEAYRPAFVALLEAVEPDAKLYLGTGGDGWSQVSAAKLADLLELEEYVPRTFSDADQARYAYAVNTLGTYRILRGDGTGRCNPQGELTRGELCALLAQALNYAPPVEKSPFADVQPADWYAPAIAAMAELGFVEGDGDGNFRPMDTVTAEELIAALARLGSWMSVKLYEAQGRMSQEDLAEEDLAGYSEWARPAVWLLSRSQRNLLGGYINYLWSGAADIDPQAPATREQAAYGLWRLLDVTGALAG